MATEELTPNLEHFNDPYVLQLIETVAKQEDHIEEEKERYDALWEMAGQWEELANANKIKAGEMQLVAGRYQYQFEQAVKCINAIDDLFEYAFRSMTLDGLRVDVRKHLDTFTKAVKPKK